MFPSLRNNFGNITFIYPLSAVMGWMFGASLWEILYAANVMWITAAIMLITDDIWPVQFESNDAYKLTDEELEAIDIVVNEKHNVPLVIVTITNELQQD